MAIFWVVWITWWTSEVLLSVLSRSGKKDKKRRDRGSFWVIWMVITVAMTAAIMFSIKIKLPISHHNMIHYIGLAVVITGMVFRIISILSLGRLFTVDVTIRENHVLKKDGIYKLTRHPAYASSLLSFTGFGISLNNWLSLITITLLLLVVFIYRIRIEESALIEQFGEEYLEYKRNTYYLLPWIY
jgi:protein-S-isoprenylcysteine O-methyltransferase Ste14